MSRPYHAVLIGGPQDLTKMVLRDPIPEIRVALLPDSAPLCVTRGPDTCTFKVRINEARYRRTTSVRPTHGEETLIYVYEGANQ